MLTRRLTPPISVSASSPFMETIFTGIAKHTTLYCSPNPSVIQTRDFSPLLQSFTLSIVKKGAFTPRKPFCSRLICQASLVIETPDLSGRSNPVGKIELPPFCLLASGGCYSNAGYDHSESCNVCSINRILTSVAYHTISERSLGKLNFTKRDTFVRTKGILLFR
jgi:hypothetical protein